MTAPEPTSKFHRRSQPKEARRLARLVAVQALYQADIMQQSAVLVLKEFETHRLTLHKGHQYLFDVDTAEVLGTIDIMLMRPPIGAVRLKPAPLEPLAMPMRRDCSDTSICAWAGP